MKNLFAWIIMTLFTTSAGAQLPFDQNKDVRTGPEVGEKIPDFRVRDQHGKWIDFDTIKGPKGALIVFHRSADW